MITIFLPAASTEIAGFWLSVFVTSVVALTLFFVGFNLYKEQDYAFRFTGIVLMFLSLVFSILLVLRWLGVFQIVVGVP